MASQRPLKVLLVDDSALDVELTRALLKSARSPWPFQIESVGDLGAAIKRLARKDIDVVLLDLGLPDSRGLDGVRRLGKDAPSTPVVVLTGHDDDSTGLQAVQEGAQDYLVKGRVDGYALDRSLRYAIERKRAEQALARLAAIMGGICYECGRKLGALDFGQGRES